MRNWPPFRMGNSLSIVLVISHIVSSRVVFNTTGSEIRIVDPHIHVSLDLYAFVAIVPPSLTLDALIHMAQTDNTLRQHLIDKGVKKHRNLDVNAPCHACLPAGYSFHGQVCCAVFYQSTIRASSSTSRSFSSKRSPTHCI